MNLLIFKIFIFFHNINKLAQARTLVIENEESQLSLAKCGWVKDTMLKQQGNPERGLKVGNSQKGFTKGKLCLTSQNAFCGEMLGSVAEWRAVDVCLKFSKAFDILLQSTHIASPRK